MQRLGRTLLLSRTIHSSPVTFQFVKDVYKKIDFEVPYGQEQRDLILSRINDLPEADLHSYISKKMSKAIRQHREKSGMFEAVEQLLDMPKMDPKAVNKLCVGLVKTGEDLKDQQEVNLMKKHRLMFTKDIVPKPDVARFVEQYGSAPTVVSLSVSLKRIGYAKVELDGGLGAGGSLACWSLDIPAIPLDDLAGVAPYQHHNLYQLVSEGLTRVPSADYYILEEMPPILPKDPSLKSKINLMRVRQALLALLMERRPGAEVHTIKPNVVDYMFDLNIGGERKAMKIGFFHLVREGDEHGNYRTLIDEEMWDYYGRSDSHGKETLLGCLAQALAFHRLCTIVEEEE